MTTITEETAPPATTPAPAETAPETTPEPRSDPAPDGPAGDPGTPADVHEMRMETGRAGDTVTWDPTDPASVTAAREAFNRERTNGALIYQADGPETGGVQVKEFDPAARNLVVVHPLQGG